MPPLLHSAEKTVSHEPYVIGRLARLIVITGEKGQAGPERDAKDRPCTNLIEVILASTGALMDHQLRTFRDLEWLIHRVPGEKSLTLAHEGCREQDQERDSHVITITDALHKRQ